jgi:hypothetical protein
MTSEHEGKYIPDNFLLVEIQFPLGVHGGNQTRQYISALFLVCVARVSVLLAFSGLDKCMHE